MSSTTNNMLTKNYRGKVGKQYVMKTRGDKSIIASLPKRRDPGVPVPPNMLQLQKKFQRASIYARMSNTNPDLMLQYADGRRGNQTAFNVAFLDAYKGPEIGDLRADAYKGQPGQPLFIEAIDNFRVTSVRFTLIAPDGSILEEGDAQMDETTGYDWIYTTKVANPSLTGTTIRVVAEDLPKNRTLFEAVL